MTTQNNFDEEEYSAAPNLSQVGANKPEFKNKVSEFGKKSLSPLVNLLGRYKSDIIPYSSSVVRAMDGAIETLLSGEVKNAEVDQTVAGWLSEAREWFHSTSEQLQNGNPKDLLNYFQGQAQKNPGLMFSVSYAVGLIFGRAGRYWGHMKNSENAVH